MLYTLKTKFRNRFVNVQLALTKFDFTFGNCKNMRAEFIHINTLQILTRQSPGLFTSFLLDIKPSYGCMNKTNKNIQNNLLFQMPVERDDRFLTYIE